MRNSLKHSLIPAAALLMLVLVTSACVTAKFKPVKKIGEVKAKETLIVGRIILVPPLQKDEQIFGTGMFDKSEETFRNKVFLITDDTYRRLPSNLGTKEWGSMIGATFDEPFYVKGASKPFFILAGMVKMQSYTTQTGRVVYIHDENAWLPGGLKVNLQPTDRAVYIGTVKYHRNEFFDITKAEIIDEFKKVRQEFQKKFGRELPLQKRMVVVLKSDKSKGGKKTGKKKK